MRCFVTFCFCASAPLLFFFGICFALRNAPPTAPYCALPQAFPLHHHNRPTALSRAPTSANPECDPCISRIPTLTFNFCLIPFSRPLKPPPICVALLRSSFSMPIPPQSPPRWTRCPFLCVDLISLFCVTELVPRGFG